MRKGWGIGDGELSELAAHLVLSLVVQGLQLEVLCVEATHCHTILT